MLKEFWRYLHDRFDKKGRLASASIILGEPVDDIRVTYVGFARTETEKKKLGNRLARRIVRSGLSLQHALASRRAETAHSLGDDSPVHMWFARGRNSFCAITQTTNKDSARNTARSSLAGVPFGHCNSVDQEIARHALLRLHYETDGKGMDVLKPLCEKLWGMSWEQAWARYRKLREHGYD